MATTAMVAVFLMVCIAMILIVLIQRPQGGGLSGAFGASGGGGAGQTAFGTKTGDVLTWATIGIFVLFVFFAVMLNFATRPPEAKDNTPTLVTPGTPRETVDDEPTPEADQPAADAESTPVETPVEAPAEVPASDPAVDPAADPSDG